MTAYLLLLLLLIPVLSIVWWTVRTGISPLPASPPMRRSLDALLPEGSVAGEILELGSGWGGLAFHLADRFPGAWVTGVELSSFPYYVARLRLFLRPRRNLVFERRDFMADPLGDPALIVCYLYPEAMPRLKKKIETELGSGFTIVSVAFAFPDWMPDQGMKSNDFLKTPVLLYRR